MSEKGNSRRAFYQKQLAQLKKQLAAVESDLAAAPREVDRLRMKKEAEKLLNKIEEVEVKLDDLDSSWQKVDTSANSLTLYCYECTNDSYTEDLGNGVTLTLMLIPAGQFMMGNPESEQVQRQVSLSPFLIGRYPVTQDQWRVIAGYDLEDIELPPEPSKFKDDSLPVEAVNWYEATEFCKRLSKRTGRHYHLPSEAQWEYACRAETDTDYHFGPQLTPELANYGANEYTTTAVGRYPANRWGLHDMHGNLWEWCQDQWHQNYKGAPINGSAWEDREADASRILRGGSWDIFPRNCRSAYRDDLNPDSRDDNIGFRVVCSAPRALQ